jgi:hypothetical protein
MATNRRIFYAVQAVGLAPLGSLTFTNTHGLQTVGITTNYTLENVQEIGQISVYQLVEMVPEIEVNLEKKLDGYPLLYHLFTQGSPTATLVGRSAQRTNLALSVYGDTQNSASGTPIAECYASGLYWSSVNYSFSTEQTLTETLSAVGNDITWATGIAGFTYTPTYNNTDSPLALAGSGGVQIRRDIIFYPILGSGDPNYAKETSSTLDVNGQLSAFLTILPPDVTGISSSGTNDRNSVGQYNVHVTQITCGTNAGRDPLLELGRKDPFFRFINFPVEVNYSITTLNLLGAGNVASEQGLDGLGDNVLGRSCKIRVREGTFIDLGTKGKLQSVTYGGGDATGGNVLTTYNFITYNDFSVTHPQDPSQLPWPY